MPKEIENKDIIHLLAHVFAYQKANHSLLIQMTAVFGDEKAAEIFQSLQEQISSDVHRVLQIYGVEGYDGPELSQTSIDDLLK